MSATHVAGQMSEISAFFFSIATGFVAAGLTSSFYRLVTNKPPSFQLHSGTMMWQMIGVFENRPPFWMLLSGCIATMWSFLSGLFLLGVMLAA